MVITALEADDTSAWQARRQVEEDPESGGLGLEVPSEAELEHVLGVSTTTSLISSLRDLRKLHADYTHKTKCDESPLFSLGFPSEVEGVLSFLQ